MKKQIKSEVIFTKHYDGMIRWFKASDLPTDLRPTDLISLHIDEGYYSENNSYDAYSELTVYREREETDEELAERIKFWEDKKEESRLARLAQYKKLKEEFDA